MIHILDASVALKWFTDTFHTNHSFYDCLYIALASHLGARLLTADAALYKKARLFVPATLL